MTSRALLNQEVSQRMAAAFKDNTPVVSVCTRCGRRYDFKAWWDLEFIGCTHTPPDEHGPEEVAEQRNCNCGSTLARIWSPV